MPAIRRATSSSNSYFAMGYVPARRWRDHSFICGKCNHALPLATTGVVANEAGAADDFAGNSEFTGNSDLLSDNTTLPADEGNGTLATDNSATLSNAQ